MTPSGDELRDKTRQQILDSMGGWSGTVVAAIPPVVFVAVNAITELRPAIIAALASGVVLAAYRLIRRQSLQQALAGLFSVAVAAAIAARTGQARGFFLVGIAGAIIYAVAVAVTLIVRRPLVGLLWEYLDPSPLPDGVRWHKVRELRRGYDLATVVVLAMFVARAAVQVSLFQHNRTGWLAVAKLAMGFPLYIAVIGVVFWVVRRTRHRLGLHVSELGPADLIEGHASSKPAVLPAGGETSGGADGLPDRGLGLGQRDEE